MVDRHDADVPGEPRERGAGEPPEFDPTQLDGIEDALEDLEGLEDLGSLGLDAASTQRLADFQSILAMSREAFPAQEPAPGLLAGIIAQARDGEGSLSAPPDPSAQAPERGWTKWIVWLALAGSAAGVLMVVRPTQDETPRTVADASTATKERGAAAKNDAPSQESAAAPVAATAADDSTAATAGSTRTTPTGVAQAGDAPAALPSAPGSTQAADDAEPLEAAMGQPAKVEQSQDPGSKAKHKSAAPNKAESQERPAKAGPEATPTKDAAWDQLTRAHSLRRRGECTAARQIYRGLRGDSLPATLRAQAQAGTGLCREYEGDDASAQSRYSEARDALRGIDGWIAAEREEMRAVGKAPKKKSARSTAPANAAFDEF